jgi:phosphinothricin acetyltransferase
MSPQGLHLREAGEQDLPAITEIYNSTIPSRMVTADLSPVSVESRRIWLGAHNPATRPVWVLVDEKLNRVIGWMSFDTFFARAAYDGTAMLAIYLAESHRGHGLGTFLLGEAMERAPRHKVHTILGYIFGHNTPSLKLFEKMGFERWAQMPRIAILDGVERDLIIVGRRIAKE